MRAMHCILNLSVPQLKRVILDITLTINMHPSNLCIETEEDGKLYVGKNVHLKVWVAQNLFEFEEKARSHQGSSSLRQSSANIFKHCGSPRTLATDSYIPSRILHVRLGRGSTMFSVVVVEHRNIATALTWLENSLTTCLIVMVCHRSFLSTALAH